MDSETVDAGDQMESTTLIALGGEVVWVELECN